MPRWRPTRSLNGGAYVKSGGRASLQGDERAGAARGMFNPARLSARITFSRLGRWPANLIHDGSDEVLAAVLLDTGVSSGGKGAASGDASSAARFFYTAKADASDRAGSKHPTVPPARPDAVAGAAGATPKGGTVL